MNQKGKTIESDSIVFFYNKTDEHFEIPFSIEFTADKSRR